MKTAYFLKSDITTSQNLVSGALSYTTTLTRAFKVEYITFRASVAITETITITLDSVNGANYDTVLREIALIAETDYVWTPPEGKGVFQAGDKIKVQCTNANLTGTIYVVIRSSEI